MKKALDNGDITISRSRICRLMKEIDIQSNYTKPSYKPTATTPNEESVKNVLNREFAEDKEMPVLVSDLTYLKVGRRWNYVCFLIDFYNREIVGWSIGAQIDGALV